MKKHYLTLATTLLLSLTFHAQAQMITTFAGVDTGGYNADGIPATTAQLDWPMGISVDAAGNVYLADSYNNRIRKVSVAGIISTVAGSGLPGQTGDGGPATDARLENPYDVAIDTAGNLYVPTFASNCVRKISPSGIITTITGSPFYSGFSGDGGPATDARLYTPTSVCADRFGNIYIADRDNNRIRKINSAGIMSTCAGGGSYSGTDTVVAGSVQLYRPEGVAVDHIGNLYITDRQNNLVREVDTSGRCFIVAGTGSGTYGGDGGPASAASVYYPTRITVDAAGNIIFDDHGNSRVRIINTSGIINTVAGNGIGSYSGDGGPATAAGVGTLWGVAVDTAHNLYCSQVLDHHVVRKIAGYTTHPAIHIAGSVATPFCSGTTDTFTATATGIAHAHYQWTKNSVAVGADTNKYITNVLANHDTIACQLSYSNGGTPTGISNKLIMAIDSFPSSGLITGPDTVCVGDTIHLSDSTLSGTWSTAMGLTTVSSTGFVVGTFVGTDTLIYTVTNICGSSHTPHLVVVVPNTYCHPERVNSISATTPYLSISPNPGQGLFRINVETNAAEQVVFRLTNLTGNLIREASGVTNTSFDLDLSNEPAGLYFLIAATKSAVYSGKVLLLAK